MSAATSSPEILPAPTRTSLRRIRTPVVAATIADHPAVCCFLSDVLDRPQAAQFKAAVDDPSYRPHDRLLLRRGERIVAHAHLTHRTMQFGGQQLPVAGLHDVCVAQSHRAMGYGRYLLEAAERQMAADGALVGWLKTSAPHFFRRTGWALCGRHNYSRASARALLARLLDRMPERRDVSLHIRPWRKWDLEAMRRIYDQNLHGAFGSLQRSEAYWQWLVEREAFDQIFVALEGTEQLELGEQSSRIVGYAVMQGERIVELLTAPDRATAAVDLIARVCGDAIEHDRSSVALHAPTEHPLHADFLDAGGTHRQSEADQGAVYMARLLDPLALLTRLAGEFFRRAEKARLPRPVDLGLLVDGRKYQVELRADGVGVTPHRLGRSYLRLNIADFTRLLLGQLDWQWALGHRRVEVSTSLALQAGRALFPALPLYRPIWDELDAGRE
jgi:predicted acetyltransferase